MHAMYKQAKTNCHTLSRVAVKVEVIPLFPGDDLIHVITFISLSSALSDAISNLFHYVTA